MSPLFFEQRQTLGILPARINRRSVAREKWRVKIKRARTKIEARSVGERFSNFCSCGKSFSEGNEAVGQQLGMLLFSSHFVQGTFWKARRSSRGFLTIFVAVFVPGTILESLRER